MTESVEAYLANLRNELAGSDAAIIQDALADAEEHLRHALDQLPGSEKEVSEAEALLPIIEKYGSPEEIAAAYRDIATLTYPALAERKSEVERPFIYRFFSIISDARAWGALLYLIFSMITGLVYFTYAITGLSFSLSLMVLIIGLPFTALFLLSVRSIALVEGRIVEALLGVRMPRRPFFTDKKAGWWQQVKALMDCIGVHGLAASNEYHLLHRFPHTDLNLVGFHCETDPGPFSRCPLIPVWRSIVLRYP